MKHQTLICFIAIQTFVRTAVLLGVGATIYKVGRHLMNVHMRDIDGLMRQFPAFGRGVMDIQAIIMALKKVGFNGFASIEQDRHPGDPNIRETCREYLRIMREYI